MLDKLVRTIDNLCWNAASINRENHTFRKRSIDDNYCTQLIYICKKDYNTNTIEIPLYLYIALYKKNIILNTSKSEVVATGLYINPGYIPSFDYTSARLMSKLSDNSFSELYFKIDGNKSSIYVGLGCIFNENFDSLFTISVECDINNLAIIKNIIFKFNSKIQINGAFFEGEIYSKLFKSIIKDIYFHTTASVLIDYRTKPVLVDFGKIDTLWQQVNMYNDSEICNEIYYANLENQDFSSLFKAIFVKDSYTFSTAKNTGTKFFSLCNKLEEFAKENGFICEDSSNAQQVKILLLKQ